MSDLLLNVRQVSNYPARTASDGTESLLVQVGGLGGPYQSIRAQTLVSTALSSASIGVGSALPGDAAPGTVLAQHLTLPLSGDIFWNAYFANDGNFHRWQSGLAAGAAWFPQTGFWWGLAPSGAAGSAVGFLPQMELGLAGNLMLSQGTLRVARDPGLPMEVATRNWVQNSTVASFNGRRGAVTLSQQDVYTALAPDSPLATEKTISDRLQEFAAGYPMVNAWNGRIGSVWLQLADVMSTFFEPGARPIAPTPPPTDASARIATTEWVANFAYQKLWTDLIDIFAPLNSPVFTGNPTAPNPPLDDDSQSLATTEWVRQMFVDVAAGVLAFNGRSGFVNLLLSDLNTVFMLPGAVPTVLTAPPGSSSTQIANTAFVRNAVDNSVTSFNTRIGAVLFQLADFNTVSTAAGAIPLAPTAAAGTATTQIATTEFVDTIVQDYVLKAGDTLTGPLIYASPPSSGATGDDELVNKLYVDEAIAATKLWQGTWEAENNVPDLTSTTVHVNGYHWAVVLTDPTAPYTIPATPVLPGLNGEIVFNGDNVYWSDTANAFQIVSGSTISLSQANDTFVAKAGSTMTGPLILDAAPLATATALTAASKGYVDTRAVPTGGTQYQVLQKTAAADWSLGWTDTAARPGSNTVAGTGAFNLTATGTNNTALGQGALAATTSGGTNVGVGAGALAGNLTGANNVAVGANALGVSTVGNNTAVGRSALAATTTAAGVTALGYQAMLANTTGGNTTAVGYRTLAANVGGNNNTAVGTNAMVSNTSGGNNTAVGIDALYSNISGSNTTAIGINALRASTGSNNTAIGASALQASTTPGDLTALGFMALGSLTTGSAHTAIGSRALSSCTTGTENIAVGQNAMQLTTTGSTNIAMGVAALQNNLIGSGNVAIGYTALRASTAGANVAVGSGALAANTTGTNNTAIGYLAMFGNTGGPENTAVGSGALQNSTSQQNTGVGYQALYTMSNAGYNTAVGHQALYTNNGNSNTAVGYQALRANVNAEGNVALGYQALRANTTGANNVAIGYSSMSAANFGGTNVAVGNYTLAVNLVGDNTAVGHMSQTATTNGYQNTALGSSTLQFNTTGFRNTAVGFQGLRANVTGSTNTAVGYLALSQNTANANTAVGGNALQGNTAGGGLTAMGSGALQSNTTGNYNTAFGASALLSCTTGYNNTAMGVNTMNSLTTGTFNAGFGEGALQSVLAGVDNACVGHAAMNTLTTGDRNVAVGPYAGTYFSESVTALTQSSNSIFIGGSTRAQANNQTRQIVIGYDVTGGGSNSVTIGSGAFTGVHRVNVGWTIGFSDVRTKQDIVAADLDRCVEVVKALPVKRWGWADFVPQRANQHEIGWLAEDVEKVLPKSVSVLDEKIGNRLIPDCLHHNAHHEALPMLWGAVQKLIEKNEELDGKVRDLQAKLRAVGK